MVGEGATAPGEAPVEPSMPPFMADAIDRRLSALESRLALAEQALAEVAAPAQQVQGFVSVHPPATLSAFACTSTCIGRLHAPLEASSLPPESDRRCLYLTAIIKANPNPTLSLPLTITLTLSSTLTLTPTLQEELASLAQRLDGLHADDIPVRTGALGHAISVRSELEGFQNQLEAIRASQRTHMDSVQSEVDRLNDWLTDQVRLGVLL